MISHLRKTHGRAVAAHDVSFSRADGEIFGIPGPSGAGALAVRVFRWERSAQSGPDGQPNAARSGSTQPALACGEASAAAV